MKPETHFAIGRLAILMVLAAAGTAQPMDGTGGPVGPATESSQTALLREQGAPAFEPVRLTYEADGVVSVLSDGQVIVSFSNKTPVQDDEAEPQLEPGETYVLLIDARGFRLVEADGQWFLDRDGTALERRGLLPSEVSIVSLDQDDDDQSEGPQGQSILTIQGDLLLDLALEREYAHLEVWDGEASAVFDLEFTLGQAPDFGVAHACLWSGCWVRCSPFSACGIICPFGKCAHCVCEDGLATCWCEDCGDGGGSGGIDMVDVDIEAESSAVDPSSTDYESESSASGSPGSWGS